MRTDYILHASMCVCILKIGVMCSFKVDGSFDRVIICIYTCMVSRKARLLHERESKILTCNQVAQDPRARWLPSSELTEGHNLTY